MSAKVFLVVYMLCYVYSVLSQLPPDGDEEDGGGRMVNRSYCAVLINDTDSDYERSVCRLDDLPSCLEYDNTVTVETDPISHVGARSRIHAEINPNATTGQDTFYYAFCLMYNWTSFELMACASGGLEVDVSHRWKRNGLAWVMVQVLSPTVGRYPLGCNYNLTTVAGDFGLKLDMDIYDEFHPLSPSQPHSSIPTPTASPGNGTNVYVTGNIIFVPKPSVMITEDFEYFYTYDFGDNSSLEHSSDFNTTHLYEQPGNYSYYVKAFAVKVEDHSVAYYKKHNGTLIIFEPISNVTMGFNHNNSIKVDSKVSLHIACAGSLPISVCWQIHSINSSQPMPFDPENDNDTPTCVSLNSSSLHYEMTFREKGKFEIVATFQNNISRVNLSYTFQVVEGPKPTIVATTTSIGVVFGIVVAIVVVLIIMAVGGYLPYRRYRSQMIETADFKFVDLSEKKRSAWQRFKLKVSKLYAQIRPQRSTEKVGLVNLISGPQYDGQTSSSSSNSYNTF